MRAALVAWWVVTACGDNQQPIEIAVPEGTPAFVGYKANGAWHDAKPTERGYQIVSDGPYQFVFVCGDDQTFDVEELFADPSDGDQVVYTQVTSDACRVGRGDATFAEVTGTVMQAGSLELGGGEGAAGDQPGWGYDVTTVEGRQGLVFRPSTADLVVVRRDLDLGAGANPQPAIDATVEGTALVRAALAIDGTTAAPTGTTTTLELGDGERLIIGYADGSPLVLGAGALQAGERQLVDIDIDEQTGEGSDVYTDHVRLDATELTAKLQPAPTVAYATSALGTSVTWTHEPLDAVSFELLVSTGGTPSILHGVATPTASAASTLDLAVDRDAPGFLDAWRPPWSQDLASSSRAFQVQASRDGGCYETLLVNRERTTAYTSPSSRCDLVQR